MRTQPKHLSLTQRWLSGHAFSGQLLMGELLASVVVFLVALPLCMGIAIASGVPAALGLITGIVGGIVVGALAGSPLQVSGPAAGLAVIIFDLVTRHGLKMLGPVVLVAGLIQLLAGLLRLGQWFRAVSPAVIKGMLAGIGALIFSSQLHVMIDDVPRKTGIQNLLAIPESLHKATLPIDGSAHHLAAAVGLLTIVSLVGWEKLKPAKLKAIPGALVGVLMGTGLSLVMGWKVKLVQVPDSLIEAANWMSVDGLMRMTEGPMLGAAVGMALIASAETLLSASAVDKLHSGERTGYDRELAAQGVGNMLCGVFGALPMTGVIVRSSANVEAGGKTRLSTIFHGLWMLGLVALLPVVLQQVPTSALAAILVFTGYKLVNPAGLKPMWRFDRAEFAIYAITFLGIVGTNLLTGVMLGIGAAALRLIFRLSRLNIVAEVEEDARLVHLRLDGFATFIRLPKLAAALEQLPQGYNVHVDIDSLAYIDHACIELLEDWERSRGAGEGHIVQGWEAVYNRYHIGPHTVETPNGANTDPSVDRRRFTAGASDERPASW